MTYITSALSKIFCYKILGLSIHLSIFRILTYELKQGEILQSLRDLITNKIGDGARVGLKYPHVIRGKDWWNFWRFIDSKPVFKCLIHTFQNFGWTIIQRNDTISKEYNICGNNTELNQESSSGAQTILPDLFFRLIRICDFFRITDMDFQFFFKGKVVEGFIRIEDNLIDENGVVLRNLKRSKRQQSNQQQQQSNQQQQQSNQQQQQSNQQQQQSNQQQQQQQQQSNRQSQQPSQLLQCSLLLKSKLINLC